MVIHKRRRLVLDIVTAAYLNTGRIIKTHQKAREKSQI